MGGLLYFGFAAATIALTSDGRAIAPIWPANAVLLALLLRAPSARWADVLGLGFLADVLANLVMRGTLAGPLLYGAMNLIEVSLAALALRQALAGASPAGTPTTLARFILWAGIVAPATSGVGGAATAALVFGEPLLPSFQTWFISDALGLLIFTPFFLSLFKGEFVTCFRERSALERLEIAGLHVLTLGLALIVFSLRVPLLFLLFPPVMLVSFRAGRVGTELSVMIIAVVGAVSTLRGMGPMQLVTSDPVHQVEAFQFLLAVLLLSCMPMTAGLSERRRETAELAARERLHIEDKAELAKRTRTDPLTGLLNRTGFHLEAEAALSTARHRSLALAVMDLDNFKWINDTCGHPTGDNALVRTAEALRHNLRDAVLARIGGDEFFALFDAPTVEAALTACERLIETIRATPLFRDDAPGLTLSCGLAMIGEGMTLADAIGRADAALYGAKQAGRDWVLNAA